MTDALHDFAVEVTDEPFLNNLMDSRSHDFSSVIFCITSTNIWQTTNLKNISTFWKLTKQLLSNIIIMKIKIARAAGFLVGS